MKTRLHHVWPALGHFSSFCLTSDLPETCPLGRGLCGREVLEPRRSLGRWAQGRVWQHCWRGRVPGDLGQK